MKEHDTQPTPETDAAQFGTGRVSVDFARKLERERDEALQWKREQMLVESQWDAQAVGRELGMTAGTDIRKSILPAIQQLKHERDELREELARMQTMAASVADTIAVVPIEDVRPLVGMLEQIASWHPQASDFDKQCAKALDEFHAKHSLP